jgi:uracil-DNA glycosylase
VPPATDDTAAALAELRREVEECTRCPLHATRTKAVFGEGDEGAELMFVGEAPGYHEDQQGRPFVGAAGKLLEELLGSIGLTRRQVFIANVLKSRPPDNRDPQPEEIAACQPYLWRQIELIRPKVVCTLGNHATKLLSGDQTGITKVHGRPRPMEIAGVKLYLYPIFHPAAALYTPAMLATLREDVARLPDLLAHARGERPAGSVAAGAPSVGGEPAGLSTSSAAEATDTPRPVWRPAAAPAPAQPPADATLFDGASSAEAPADSPAEAETAGAEQLGLF